MVVVVNLAGIGRSLVKDMVGRIDNERLTTLILFLASQNKTRCGIRRHLSVMMATLGWIWKHTCLPSVIDFCSTKTKMLIQFGLEHLELYSST